MFATCAGPSEPRNVRVEGVGATVLYVMWGTPLDNGGRPILNYRITLNEIPNFSVDVESNTFSFIIRKQNLAQNTTYK